MSAPVRPPIPAQSWLSLFYDLAFVAAIVVVSASFSHDYSLGQVGWLIVVFTLIWCTWLITTLRMAAAPVERTWPRVLIVTQMGLVLLMAITSDDADGGRETVGALFGAILVTAALLNRSLTRADESSRLNRSELLRLAAAVVLFVATWWVPPGTWVAGVLWVTGLVLVGSTLHTRLDWTPDQRHTVGHRFGEFTIIVLGESFLKVALVAGEEPVEQLDVLALPMIFGIITALWWLYFAHVAPGGVPARHRAWVGMHLPLHLFMVGLAVGLSKLLVPESAAYTGSGFALICVPLVGALVSMGVLIRLTRGPYARRGLITMLVAAAAVVGVVIMSYVGRGLEFDLAGTAALMTIILAASVRSLGRHARPDRDQSASEPTPVAG